MTKTTLRNTFHRIHYTDICAIVQRLRETNWVMTVNKLKGRNPVWLSHHNPDGFIPVLDDLRNSISDIEDEDKKAVAAALITEIEKIHTALTCGALIMPSVDAVLKRYIDGEFGERTAQEVLDLDIQDFHEALHEHGFPIIRE